MKRRAFAVAALAGAALLGASAGAEENRWNVHLEVGPSLLVDQPTTKFSSEQQLQSAGLHLRGTVELSPHERLGLELAYAADLYFLVFHSSEVTQQGFFVGARFRPWYNHEGGYVFPGGKKMVFVTDLLSDFYIDAHVGASTSDTTRLAFDVGVGLRLPLVSPIQVGLFARWQQLIAVSGPDETAFKMISLGVSVSAGFFNIHGEPDEDGDGVPDSVDHCAGSPPGARVNEVGCPVGAEEEHGASQACSDSDLDGVCDGEDECPGTTLGTKVDKHGCPANSEAQTAPDEPDASNPPPAP